jgi:hypothetical protein
VVLSEPLERLVRHAKSAGWLYIAIGLIVAVGGLIATRSGIVRGDLGRVLIEAGAFYVVPGPLLLFFANRLDAGHAWGAVGVVAVAALSLLNILLFAMAIGCCGMFLVNAPAVLLLASSLNALSEIQHLFRIRRREREQFTGGFPVLPVRDVNQPERPTMASVKPPLRPARMARKAGPGEALPPSEDQSGR